MNEDKPYSKEVYVDVEFVYTLANLLGWEVEEDNGRQLVIYTGLYDVETEEDEDYNVS